ncbi:MAG TPA: hypothetical protein VHH34_26025 [Pseudonocardiaceae bacterium]|nr:hypothetical protein [Pseudonocardiaceae bacterium]
MNATVIGLAVGMALGFAAAFGGFGALAIVLLFGILGGLTGRYLDGQLDLSDLFGGGRDRGRQ